MQGKSDLIHIKRKTLLFLFIAFLVLGIATPVLADYLGPDRTTTESYTDTYDYGVWARDNNRIPYCLDKRGNKADDCIVCEWERRPGNACGDATYWYTLGTISEVVETTVSLPPATISSSLQNCSLNNGWCNTASELSLNGTEPLSGYNILAIEGSLNGQPFACSGSNCNVSLNEGNNDLSFWALSSYGDSSTMGTNSAKVDTVSPSVGLDLSGSSGTNGWFVSLTTITATGSDATSGLLSALLSVNSGPWESSSILSEGVHNISVQAEDNAGNTANSSTTISVDTITPTIDVSVNGTLDSNGWYSTSMEVIAVANDATSGVASLESSLDGGVYQAYISPVSFADGYHTIQFKAVDKAGNETETSVQGFYVDTIIPAIDLPAEWEVNDTITYKVQDDGSGLSALRIVIEDEDEKFAKVAWDEAVSGNKFKGEIKWDGKFKDGIIAPPGEYLVWVKVTDVAGNERVTLGSVIVPQPVSFFNPLPTIITSTETPLPPADLFDPEDSPTNATPQNSSFGGSTTTAKDNAQQSLSLASGTVSASTSTTTNSNILWGATAAAMLGAVTAYILDEKRKREAEKARETQEQERRAKMKAQKMAKLEAQWAQERIWEQARLEEQQAKMQQDAVARMETKMERIEAEEDARWTASQAATYERAEAKKKAEGLQAGLAAYYSAMRQGEKEAQLKAEKEKPWWQKVWDTAKTYVQEKIVEPAQKAWNQYVYMPIVQPVVGWWKEEIPVWAKETGLSLIPIVGDGWGVIRQAIHFFKKEPVDKVDVGLSIVGLIFDIPWPQEGLIGGDVAIAALKGLNAAIPSGPARDVMTQLIKDGLKNPDDLARIVKTSEALLKNDNLLKALIDNPQALETIMLYGPEAVEVLARFPTDETITFLQKYGDDGLQRMLKYKDMPTGLADEAFPLGFKNVDEFKMFEDTIRRDLSEAGYENVELYVTGSSVSGMSYPKPEKPSLPFDSIQRGASDYDIGIVSEDLWQKAIDLGLKVKDDPIRIGPLDLKSKNGQILLEKLGLLDLVENMNTEAGRDTGFMIYQSAEDFLTSRGPAIAFPDN